MTSRLRWAGVVLALAILVLVATAAAEVRTWTDASGKHQIEAELVSASDDEVVLRRTDGKEITLELKRLSPADRAFIKRQTARKATAETNAASEAVRQIADTFYRDLRTKEREAARATMSDAAQKASMAKNSYLAQLPSPDANERAIRLGRVRIDGAQAEVPVQVRSQGAVHKTALHLRMEDEAWRVFAVSAKLGDNELTINFESTPPAADAKDPLAALVGKPLALAGYTIDGSPLDTAKFAGKVVLVDFWATWCGPCRAEMPNILANWQRFHESGFEVIAVSIDEDLQALAKYVAQENPPWTVVVDRHPQNRTPMSGVYGIQGIPAFILVGKDGNVAAVHTRGERLGPAVAQLLAQ